MPGGPIVEGEPKRKRPRLSEVEMSVREQLESPTACLTSQTISQVCNRLGLEKNGIHIVDPLWFQLPSGHVQSRTSPLRHVSANSVTHLLAPIYHHKREHWSLLSVEMTKDQIFAGHFDPLPHRFSHDVVRGALLSWLHSQKDHRPVHFENLVSMP
jgi:hypothetical protein